jgi:hypothetical protein
VADAPGSDTVHVETDALTAYSRAVNGQAGDFTGGWLGSADWAVPAKSRQAHMDNRFDSTGEALHSMDSSLPDGQKFWETHGRRVVEMDDFNSKLSMSLQAISAASGAIVQAYESTDAVNADDIRGSAAFFRDPKDTSDATLQGARIAQQRAQPG